MRVRLLIGGSPCTKWSIAQSKDRETKPEGIGWELFKNFLIAKEKFKPDVFLCENNKSAAQPIKDQISRELEVPLQYINSALVSAQNRQRFYAHNIVDVPQPEDRGLLLRDVLESGEAFGTTTSGKGYCLDANYHKGLSPDDVLDFGKRTQVAEPVNITADGKAQCLRATYYKDGIRNLVGNTVDRKTCVAEPVRIGDLPNDEGKISGSQATRIYDIDGKSVNLVANGGGQGAKTGLYAIPVGAAQRTRDTESGRAKVFEVRSDEKSNALTTVQTDSMVVEYWDGKTYPVYTVQNGQITIKGKQYPIKLSDGYYIIRKLTPIECERLQTLPDNYTAGVSNTQRYKALGNGWTAEVIIHILRHANIPLDAEIEVLSMYDGIATGRYCLDAMGYKNVRYHAYEIDKYPIVVAQKNYPDIIQRGDAFAVRESGWSA